MSSPIVGAWEGGSESHQGLAVFTEKYAKGASNAVRPHSMIISLYTNCRLPYARTKLTRLSCIA